MQTIDHSKSIIKLQHVSFAYDEGIDIVKDISFNIHQGDYLGIIGPNGGGKTTLLKLILGLLKATSGTITLSIPRIGYVAQNATSIDRTFPITVREVVAQGRVAGRGLFHALTQEDWRIVDQSLSQVDLLDKKNIPIGDLSRGQQQRVFIARAITGHHPHVIILDEPTTSIDANSQEQFYSLLKKLNQKLGITLILVSHDIDIITKEVTEVVIINQRLLYYGDPKKFTKTHYILHQH